jgi:hypothetical protein
MQAVTTASLLLFGHSTTEIFVRVSVNENVVD